MSRCYFLTEGAASRTLALKRRGFIEEDLPGVFDSMRLLSVDLEEFATLYHKHRRQAAKVRREVLADRELQGAKK